MAQTIILKKSAVAGKVPQAADLEVGEVAINMADRILYFKDSSGVVVAIKGETAVELTQAQAENSSSAVFGLVSGQRIRQAISKWWEGIGTAFGKTLLGSANATAARTSLQLGTAATRNVGTSSGNVMEVGAFGFGLGEAASSNTYPLGFFYGTRVVHYFKPGVPGPLGVGWSDRTSYLEMSTYDHRTTIVSDGSALYFSWVYGRAPGAGDFKRLVSTSDILTTTGQSTEYPMTQKAVTDAINARGFEDASGVLTAQLGDLSNAISNFLQATTQADAKSRLGVPNITVSTSNPSGGANGDVWYKV